MATNKSSKGAVRKSSFVRNVGEPPKDVWHALLNGKLTTSQCRSGAAWAFEKMPRSRRSWALLDLFERTIRVKERS